MAGTESAERQAVAKAYSGPRWAAKVKKMSDQQVFAIYQSLKAQKKI